MTDQKTAPGQPAPAGPPPRFVEVDGCFNFRDLGGYRTADGRTVAWRRLYRSDGLHRISGTGAAAFDALGVTTVLDLRTAEEAAENAWRPSAGWPGRRRHIPLRSDVPRWEARDRAELERADFAARHYLETVREGPGPLREAIEALAVPGALPAVFHCAAGKDRTGILAALVLRLLGVPAEDVADDYALSEEATARWEASVRSGVPDDTQTAWSYVPPSLLLAERRTMLHFLERIDAEHGSVAGFVTGLGVGAPTVAALREALLD